MTNLRDRHVYRAPNGRCYSVELFQGGWHLNPYPEPPEPDPEALPDKLELWLIVNPDGTMFRLVHRLDRYTAEQRRQLFRPVEELLKTGPPKFRWDVVPESIDWVASDLVDTGIIVPLEHGADEGAADEHLPMS